MVAGRGLPQGNEFDSRDNPSAEFIETMRRRFLTPERETDELLVRKMRRRSGPP